MIIAIQWTEEGKRIQKDEGLLFKGQTFEEEDSWTDMNEVRKYMKISDNIPGRRKSVWKALDQE